MDDLLDELKKHNAPSVMSRRASSWRAHLLRKELEIKQNEVLDFSGDRSLRRKKMSSAAPNLVSIFLLPFVNQGVLCFTKGKKGEWMTEDYFRQNFQLMWIHPLVA